MPIPTHTQIRGKAAQWLLELDLGGDVRRYAARDLETADGVVYRAGLEVGAVTLDEGLDRVGIIIQDPAEDWARYEGRGGLLDMQAATLRLWWPGMSEAQSYGILRGRTSGARTGTPGQPGRLSLSLRAGELSPSVLYPPIQRRMDRVTHSLDRANFGSVSSFDEAQEGYVYPTVVGFPGSGSVDDANPPSVIEVPLVATTTNDDSSGYRVLVADGEVDADQIELTDLGSGQAGFETIPRSSVLAVQTATDLVGQRFSFVELDSNPGTTGVQPGATEGPLAISFRPAAGWGGGLLSRERTGPLRGLGGVISWALERSGVAFDQAAQEGERGRLDGLKIDGLVAGGKLGRVDLSRWVLDDLSRVFPLRRMQSADGVWFRLQSYRPNGADAVADLSADRHEIERTSDVQTIHGRYNRFSLRYAANLQRATRVRVLAPDHEKLQPYLGTDERIIGSSVCRASETLYGPREAPEVEAPWIWDDGTAAAVLQEWSYRDSLPRRVVGYEGSGLEHLQPGDVVRVSDAEIGLASRLAIVDAVVVGGPVVGLSLIIPYDGRVLTS